MRVDRRPFGLEQMVAQVGAHISCGLLLLFSSEHGACGCAARTRTRARGKAVHCARGVLRTGVVGIAYWWPAHVRP